jgi:hypothetical protein
MHPSPHQEAGNSQAGLEVVGRTGFNVERVGDGQVVSSLLDPTQILHLVPGIGPNRPQPNSCRTVLGGQITRSQMDKPANATNVTASKASTFFRQ